MRFSAMQRKWFLGAAICVVLAAVAAVLLDLVLALGYPRADVSFLGGVPLSERSRAAMTETAGDVSVTCILSAGDPAFAPLGRLLRAFASLSREVAGAEVGIRFADPRTEPAKSAALMAQGARGQGLLFRRDHRYVFVPVSAFCPGGAYDPAEAERVIASAFARLSRVDGLRIGWLTGHGEAASDTTDPMIGFSAFRRALETEGYAVEPLRLFSADGTARPIPSDIGVLVVMDARFPLTVPERIRLSEWLDRGGRLLCFMPASGDMGLGSLFDQWGIRVGSRLRTPAHAVSPIYGLASELSPDHPVTRNLSGETSVTLGVSRALFPVDPLPAGTSVEPLVRMAAVPLLGRIDGAGDSVCVVMAAERGRDAGSDLALRSGRLVVVGSSDPATNRYLLNHATVNRDLLVNTVQWLAGNASPAGHGESGVIRLRLDSRGWRRLTLVSVLLVPGVLCVLLWLLTGRRA